MMLSRLITLLSGVTPYAVRAAAVRAPAARQRMPSPASAADPPALPPRVPAATVPRPLPTGVLAILADGERAP